MLLGQRVKAGRLTRGSRVNNNALSQDLPHVELRVSIYLHRTQTVRLDGTISRHSPLAWFSRNNVPLQVEHSRPYS